MPGPRVRPSGVFKRGTKLIVGFGTCTNFSFREASLVRAATTAQRDDRHASANERQVDPSDVPILHIALIPQ